MLTVVLALAVEAQLGPAAAQPPARPPEQNKPIVVEGKKSNQDRIQCISSVPIGSLMPQRVCHTVAEWGEMRDRELMSIDRTRKQLEAEAHARQEALRSPR
jgi:hypothetical protein